MTKECVLGPAANLLLRLLLRNKSQQEFIVFGAGESHDIAWNVAAMMGAYVQLGIRLRSCISGPSRKRAMWLMWTLAETETPVSLAMV